MKAIALLEPVRPAAPDPAFVEMAAAMEQTNRELGLTGDELIAQLETEARFGYASRCIECGKEFPVRSATDRLCARCYVEGKL